MPKNKTGGVVSTTVMGVGALLIGVIIILVVTSTLINADLFETARGSYSIVNESVTIDDRGGGVTFGNFSLAGAICSVTEVLNVTTGTTIPSSNYSVSGCNITAVEAEYNNTVVLVTSTTTFDGDSEITTNNLNLNFTRGIDNVSSKIPTILLIVAVVFLFSALILLMRNAKMMGIDGGGSL